VSRSRTKGQRGAEPGLGLAACIVAAAALLCLLVLPSAGQSAETVLASDDVGDLDLSRAFNPHSLELRLSDDGLHVATNGSDPYFQLPIVRRLKHAKLQIEFADLRGFDRVQVFYGIEDWPYSEARQSAVRPGHGQRVVREFPLPQGWNRAVRIDLDPTTGRGPALITRVSVVPMGAVDQPALPYLVALALAAALLLPGALLIAVGARREPDPDTYPVWGFAASLVFYLLAFGVLLVTRGGTSFPEAVPAFVTGLFLLLVVLAVLRRRVTTALGLIGKRPVALAAYVVLVLLACHVVIADTPLPFTNLHYGSISGPKTFGAFRAHDNLFQYVNGQALSENEPLSVPYRHGRLVYLPQDREIFPGGLYAVVRTTAGVINAQTGDSFLTYTLFGIACNAMFLFPLTVFIRRYLRPPPALIVAAVCLTAFALVNTYLSWFKFAGAALFLSGLLVLFQREDRGVSWAGAGLLCGASASMHAANALGIPFYLAWFSLRRFRAHGWQSLQSYVYPVLFAAAFTATQIPWALTKHLYYPDTHRLLRSFLFAGHDHPDGLMASVRTFFAETPLREQVITRLSNLYHSLRIEETVQTVALLFKGDIDGWLLHWNQLEFSRTAVLFYPLLGFLLLARLAQRVARDGHSPRATSFVREAPEARAALWIGIATMLCIVLIAFGRFPPDISYHQPTGVLLLAYSILSARVLASRGVIVALFATYVAFSAVRLLMFL